MKKLIAIACIIGVTVSFANEGSSDGRENERNHCKPPKEAIEICLGQATDTVCQMTTPHGHILKGTCKYTPDEKYFACAPQRGPREDKQSMNYSIAHKKQNFSDDLLSLTLS